MRGGYRTGAGRKKGFSAKKAEEAREYFSKRVTEEITTLFDVLLDKAKKGDLKAMQLLLDRAWGRPRQEEFHYVNLELEEEPSPKIKELARLINYNT